MIFIYIISLHIVVVDADNLRNMYKLKDEKKRKKERERKNKQFIYQINNVNLFFNLRAFLFSNRVTIKTTTEQQEIALR